MTLTQGRLSLAYRELTEVHPKVVEKYGKSVIELDLSHNVLSDLSSVRGFTNLETLVVDNNRITSHSQIPVLPKLKTLWLNGNKIENLSVFLDKLVEATPHLHYLSLLRNECCPSFFNGGSLKQYKDYRCYVLSRMRSLTQLDSTLVTEMEREEAKRIYGNLPMKVAYDEEEMKKEVELKRKKEQDKIEKQRNEIEKRRIEAQQKRDERREKARKKREEERRLAELAQQESQVVPNGTQEQTKQPKNTQEDKSEIIAELIPELEDLSVIAPLPSSLALPDPKGFTYTPGGIQSKAQKPKKDAHNEDDDDDDDDDWSEDENEEHSFSLAGLKDDDEDWDDD